MKKLERNIGTDLKASAELTLERLIEMNSGPDWLTPPVEIGLPTSKKVKEWIVTDFNEIWNAMFERKSAVFEKMIPELEKDSWSIVRALQYTMAALCGDIEASHPMIFTQSVWSLVDNGLVPEDIATLQVHRMLRTNLIS
ncbi:MAG: hypothetical protein IH631_10310 [Candidatus Thorarchaeota archaeon]|nr:hypothetical protein [Candidatus Thorarchaeota archaeon]